MNEAGVVYKNQTARIQELERENRILRNNVVRFETAKKRLEDDKARLEQENKEPEEKPALALFRQFGKQTYRTIHQ